jgi:hypothetical protein
MNFFDLNNKCFYIYVLCLLKWKICAYLVYDARRKINQLWVTIVVGSQVELHADIVLQVNGNLNVEIEV